MFEQEVQKQLLPNIIHYHYRISANIIYYISIHGDHNRYLFISRMETTALHQFKRMQPNNVYLFEQPFYF